MHGHRHRIHHVIVTLSKSFDSWSGHKFTLDCPALKTSLLDTDDHMGLMQPSGKVWRSQCKFDLIWKKAKFPASTKKKWVEVRSSLYVPWLLPAWAGPFVCEIITGRVLCGLCVWFGPESPSLCGMWGVLAGIQLDCPGTRRSCRQDGTYKPSAWAVPGACVPGYPVSQAEGTCLFPIVLGSLSWASVFL